MTSMLVIYEGDYKVENIFISFQKKIELCLIIEDAIKFKVSIYDVEK